MIAPTISAMAISSSAPNIGGVGWWSQILLPAVTSRKKKYIITANLHVDNAEYPGYHPGSRRSRNKYFCYARIRKSIITT